MNTPMSSKTMKTNKKSRGHTVSYKRVSLLLRFPNIFLSQVPLLDVCSLVLLGIAVSQQTVSTLLRAQAVVVFSETVLSIDY